MKKIMFNDNYGLTKAVLDGRKDMTRRIIKGDYEDVKAFHANGGWHFIADTKDGDSEEVKPAYEIGEKVAIAQSYRDIYPQADFEMIDKEFMTESAGWTNKMFVKASLMPNSIRITDMKIERLQDISDEDCLAEGIYERHDVINSNMEKVKCFTFSNTPHIYATPRDAFAALIDHVSSKGTWASNPWVFAYSFKVQRGS